VHDQHAGHVAVGHHRADRGHVTDGQPGHGARRRSERGRPQRPGRPAEGRVRGRDAELRAERIVHADAAAAHLDTAVHAAHDTAVHAAHDDTAHDDTAAHLDAADVRRAQQRLDRLDARRYAVGLRVLTRRDPSPG
jgi:hypothetical protein